MARDYHHTGGGFDVARVSAAEADRRSREQRAADARAYMLRTGNADLLEALGLDAAPIAGRRRPSRAKPPTPEDQAPACPDCGQPIVAPTRNGNCPQPGCVQARERRQRLVRRRRAVARRRTTTHPATEGEHRA